MAGSCNPAICKEKRPISTLRWRTGLYASFALHSSNTCLGIFDEDGKQVFKKTQLNDREVILSALMPYRDDVAGVVV